MSTLGIGDMTVNRLGFGAMRVCGPQIWGPPADRGTALKVLMRAYEVGHNFFDTADSYVERIDLYQLHAPDPKVPFADSVGTLAELQKAGKIRHVGLSNVSLKELEEARRIVPIVSVQNAYSLERRDSDPVLAACEKDGLAFLPWYPLAAGAALKSSQVKRVAARRNATPAQVCLAWLLARSPVMLPIPGTGDLRHLEENSAGSDLRLAPEDLAALDQAT
jgi:pyridoxine 4-dehydrogenase